MITTTEAVRGDIARVETRRAAKELASQAVRFTSTRAAGWAIRSLLDLESEAWKKSRTFGNWSSMTWSEVRESTWTSLLTEIDLLEPQVSKKVGE